MGLSRIRSDRLGAILGTIMRLRRVSRTQLARTLGLSKASVTQYTTMLLDMRLIREAEGPKSGKSGRPAGLEPDSSYWTILAAIIDFTEIRAVLLDLDGHELDEERCALDFQASSDVILESLLPTVAEPLRRASARGRGVLGIGVGVNDYVDPSEGIVYSYFNSSPWERIPLRDIMERRFGLPTHLASSQHIGALGALHAAGLDSGPDDGTPDFAAAVRCMLFVWLGRGVSAGVLINGELWEGENGCAGEFGHVTIDDDGKQCVCGARGCLETLVSESAILQRCREAMRQGVTSEMAARCGGNPEKLRIADVIAAANDGDRFARTVFDDVARLVGRQLGNLVNILNPGLIVLRGPTIDDNRFLYDGICRVARSGSLRKCGERLDIRYSTENRDVRLQGLGGIVMRDTTRVLQRISGS